MMDAGIAFVLGVAVGMLWMDWLRDRERVKLAVNGNDMVVQPQPQPDFAHAYMEREARRVERPLEERSVVGVVIVDRK